MAVSENRRGNASDIIADEYTHAAGATLVKLSNLANSREDLNLRDPDSAALLIAADLVTEANLRELEEIYDGRASVIVVGRLSTDLKEDLNKLHDAVEIEARDELTSYLEEHAPKFQLVMILGIEKFEIAAALDDVFGTPFLLDAVNSHGNSDRTAILPGRMGQFMVIWGEGSALKRGIDKKEGTIVVPASVAGIDVRYVARGAFARKQNVTGAFFMAPLRTIARGAFYRCSRLKAVTFPVGLDYIGRSAFSGCSDLREIDFPSSLRTIGPRAFRGCTRLRRVRIPRSISTIGKDAFASCSENLIFEVEENSFAHHWTQVTGMKSRIIAEEPPILPSKKCVVRDEHFSFIVRPGGKAEIVRFHDSTLAEITIPKTINGYTIAGVGYRAFCSANLRRVSCPTTLNWIAAKAFYDCPALEAVSVTKNLFLIGKDAFPQGIVDAPTVPLSRRPMDVERMRLSLRCICVVTGIELPTSLEEIADVSLRQVSASLKITKPGDLYLHRSDVNALQASQQAKRLGAVAMITSAASTNENLALPTLFVEDAMETYKSICAWFARQNGVKTIALTGSIGKTTTKEMVRLVCATQYKTVYSKGNENGVAQVGRYLQSLTRDDEVYIQETGASGFGSIDRVASFMRPNAFLVTNIGLNHVGYYGDLQENIVVDKTSHDKYLPNDGVAFLNYDDQNLRSAHIDHKVVSFGIENRDVDYYAENIVEEDGRIHFDIVDQRAQSVVRAVVYSFGVHNVYNALAAFAIGKWLKIDDQEIIRGISEYRGKGLRQNLVALGEQQVLVDCYNASEGAAASTAKALQSIKRKSGSKRYMVFADIDDKLGALTEEVHRRVGVNLADQENIDELIFFGEHAAWSAAEAKKGNIPVFETLDRNELHEHLKQILSPGDIVAFKGGQQMALSITIDSLWGTSFVVEDGDELSKRTRELELDGIKYRIIREYGVQARRISETFNRETLVLPQEVEGRPLVMVGKLFAYGRTLRKVVIPDSVVSIAVSAFYVCKALREVSLPASLLRIERSAFNNCRSLKHIVVPPGVQSIGNRAFYRCESLESIVIPSSVTHLGDDLFSYSRKVEIICEKNSYAEEFCRKHWASRVITTKETL